MFNDLHHPDMVSFRRYNIRFCIQILVYIYYDMDSSEKQYQKDNIFSKINGFSL